MQTNSAFTKENDGMRKGGKIMKRKEFQRFSKEVFAAAVVSLSVAGTTIPAQAANTQQAAAGVVKVQEQSSEEGDAAACAEDGAEAETAAAATTDAEAAETENGTETSVDEVKEETNTSIEENETENSEKTAELDANDESNAEQSEGEDTTKDADVVDEEVVSDSADVQNGEEKKVSCWETDENGKKHYYDEYGCMVCAPQEIDGKVYVFDNEGNLVISEGYFTEDQKFYIADENGKAVTGWYYWKEEKTWSYFGKDGVRFEGKWLNENGKNYYFGYSDGRMYADGTYDISYDVVNWTYWGQCKFNKDGSAVSGVQEVDGHKLGYDAHGRLADGMITDEGKKYYCKNGEIQINQFFVVDQKMYEADENGVCTEVTDKEGWYSELYYMQNGKLVIGWKQISGNWYYFDPQTGEKTTASQYRKLIEKEIGGKTYCFDQNGVMQKGWIAIQEYSYSDIVWKYAKADGSLLNNEWLKTGKTWYYFKNREMVTGAVTIGDTTHIFQENGAWVGETAKGTNGWKQVGKDWYYLENGKLVTSKMKTIQKKKYLFDENGKMRTDWEEKKESYDGIEIHYTSYYFGSSGAAYVSQWRLVPGNYWKYYDADGNGEQTGWKKINNVWYYFDKYQHVAVNQDTIIDGKLYHFQLDGSYTGKAETLKNGWKKINGQWYYFEDGSMVVNSLKNIGGKEYYFDYDGEMSFLTTEYVDGKEYYFAEDGHRVTKAGWYNNGSIYVNQAGEAESVSLSDYLSDNGKILNLVDPKTHKVVQKVSAAKGGWVQGKSGDWFYSDKTQFLSDYSLLTRKVSIGNKIYGFDFSGRMITNTWSCLRDGDGYFGASGALQMNGWCNGGYFVDGYTVIGAQKIDGKDYYFYEVYYGKDPRGVYPINTKGIFKVNGILYYYDGNGKREKISLKEGWNKLSNGDYCYVKNGELQRSAAVINGRTYGFDPKTGLMLRNSFCSLPEKKYYFNDKGEMVKNAWISDAGEWYYAGASGSMVTGSQTIKGKTYYFDYSGKWIEQ